MDIYQKALFEGLADLNWSALLKYQWPEDGRPARNRYLTILQGYWNRHRRYPALLKPPAADLYHILDHSYAHLMAKLPPEKTVITCHDLMPLMVEGYGRSWGGKLSIASFRHSVSYLNKARHIIADSGATKNALIDILALADRNITVVPLGVDEKFCPSQANPGLNKTKEVESILQVGAAAEPYKNTMNILLAFSLLLKNRGGHIKLLKVGKAYTREQQNYIEKEGLAPHIQYLGFVERNVLPEVFRKATVLLMPSLYEGFGMPLLEAMACGIPVVSSHRGSIPEVAGAAALYVDPEDPRTIAGGVEKVLNDIDLRQNLITKGLSRVKEFTWERTARETYAVYQKAIDII
jgi:glycosyltransferase involved in cell wall biosynthesis